MALFFAFLFKVLPLYMHMFLGFLAGKLLDASRETIARLMLYIINPLIIFNGVCHTTLDVSVLMLPVVTFVVSSALCIWFYQLSTPLWQDPRRNLVAFSAGSGNTGYFGIPLALLLFDEQAEGIYIMALLGITFYENSIGYYMFTRGLHTIGECYYKLLKLPALYAFLVGLGVNAIEIPLPEVFAEFIKHIKGAYAVLGMMIVGLGLASLNRFSLDFKFLGMTFLAKFVIWPVIILAIINIDIYLFGFFEQSIYDALMLIAIVPLPANMVILAALQKTYPEQAASAVLISTVFALGYIPVMANYFMASWA